jgi:DNA topoisomerase-1
LLVVPEEVESGMRAKFRFPTRVRSSRDGDPGIAREKTRGGFRYRDARGRIVRDSLTLARIGALVIPPAWTKVWICRAANGHLQAVGRDARGRKQYLYHPSFRARQEDSKFSRLAAFGRALPRIRARVSADLARPGLPRDKVLAAVVRLLDRTQLRIGNHEYRRTNQSFGLTTLLDHHVTIRRGSVRLKFRGKSGVEHEREVADRKLAAVVRSCRDVPGQHLFQYVDDRGRPRAVGSTDVNDYIRRAAGGEFTAKDFRTWAGTVLAAARLAIEELPDSVKAAERVVVRVIREVAATLGNTPAVCRKSYIHPRVIEAFAAGELPPRMKRDEARVLRLLGC